MDGDGNRETISGIWGVGEYDLEIALHRCGIWKQGYCRWSKAMPSVWFHVCCMNEFLMLNCFMSARSQVCAVLLWSDWVNMRFSGDGVAVYAMDTFFMGINHYKK